MKTVTFISALLLASATVQAQPKAEGFTTVVNQKVTRSESGCYRYLLVLPLPLSSKPNSCVRGKGEFDLSEMYIVRQKYMNQLNDNYLRHGKATSVRKHLTQLVYGFHSGSIVRKVYGGYQLQLSYHNHKELASYGSHCRNAVQMRQRSPEYDKLIKSLFDIYMGELPENLPTR